MMLQESLAIRYRQDQNFQDAIDQLIASGMQEAKSSQQGLTFE